MSGYLTAIIIVAWSAISFLLSYSKKKYKVNETGIVLITGASTGIGRHAAEHLARKSKLHVLAGVRKDKDAEEIRALKISNLEPLIIDVTSGDSVTKALAVVKDMMKRKNLSFVGLVNNAGINRRLPAEFHPVDDIRKLFETNLFAVMNLVQKTLPFLRESQGRIVSTSSFAAHMAVPMMSVYSSSKFALTGYSDSLRRELAHVGVSVSTIDPAYVKTHIAQTTGDVTNDIMTSLGAENETAAKQVYGKFMSEKGLEKMKLLLDRADEPTVTSDAIFDALLSPYPHAKYVVANSNGLPAWVADWIGWILNDRLKDILVEMNGN